MHVERSEKSEMPRDAAGHSGTRLRVCSGGAPAHLLGRGRPRIPVAVPRKYT